MNTISGWNLTERAVFTRKKANEQILIMATLSSCSVSRLVSLSDKDLPETPLFSRLAVFVTRHLITGTLMKQ